MDPRVVKSSPVQKECAFLPRRALVLLTTLFFLLLQLLKLQVDLIFLPTFPLPLLPAFLVFSLGWVDAGVGNVVHFPFWNKFALHTKCMNSQL